MLFLSVKVSGNFIPPFPLEEHDSKSVSLPDISESGIYSCSIFSHGSVSTSTFDVTVLTAHNLHH